MYIYFKNKNNHKDEKEINMEWNNEYFDIKNNQTNFNFMLNQFIKVYILFWISIIFYNLKLNTTSFQKKILIEIMDFLENIYSFLMKEEKTLLYISI